MSNSLLTQSDNTSKNYSFMTSTETILEDQHLCLVKKIMFLGVEDGSGDPRIFVIRMSSVASLGVNV